MSKSRTSRFNIVGLSIKDVLGLTVDLPAFSKLSENIESRQGRILINNGQLYTQHATTGYKIGSAAYYLSQLKQHVGFYASLGANVQKGIEENIRQVYDFQVTLECFFLFCWGSITSTTREIWMAYSLNLPREEVYFHKVKEHLKVEHPTSQIAAHLQTINDSEWFRYLNAARNRVEHGQIPLSNFIVKEKRLYLADDQNVDAGSETYKKNYDPIEWSSNIFEQTRKLIEYCSFEINKLVY